MQDKNELCRQFSVRFSESIGKLNLKQRELASLVNITEQSLSRYKSGTRIPDVFELVRLAHILNVSVDWLLGGDETDSVMWRQRALALEKKLAEVKEILPLLGEANARLSKIAAE